MKLYELSWSIYPRRVGIYLAEKGITRIDRIEVDLPTDPGKRLFEGRTPAGTVPALDTGDGLMIGSSLAILEYLEERFPSPAMLGETPNARARTRELIAVIEEATTHMGVWVHNASRLFTGREPQNPDAARVAMQAYYGRLQLLEKMASTPRGEFLAGNQVSIADCIAFSTLQTGVEFFGIPLPGGCPTLQDWYARFAKRPSGAVPPYPPPVLEITRGSLAHTLNS